jgi:Raf kinase inhibitor-like YbhB/YbcL family protein
MGLAMTKMRISSPAFEDGQQIPSRHSGADDNLSPPLDWHQPPAGTSSYALFCHDPDAPLVKAPGYGFVHWVLYNISPDTTTIGEGSESFTCGRNDYTHRNYDGPRPPEGHGRHRYFFWLLALECEPDLAEGLSLWDLLREVEPKVLGMSRIMGWYER